MRPPRLLEGAIALPRLISWRNLEISATTFLSTVTTRVRNACRALLGKEPKGELATTTFLEMCTEMPVPMYAVSEEGRFVWANRAFLELLGFSSFDELCDIDPDTLFLQETDTTTHAGELEPQALLKRSERGRTLVDISPLPILPGGVQVHLVEDTTQRRGAERSGRRMRTIIAGLARIFGHDVGNQLTTIMCFSGYMKTALDELQDSVDGEMKEKIEKIKVDLERIRNAADRIAQIAEDLREWGIVRLQGHKLKIEELSIADTITTIIKELKHSAETRGVTIHINESEFPQLSTDRVCLEIILRNLIGNAIKYSHGEVEIGMQEYEGFPAIYIADNGDGIPDDLIKAIFEPFERGGRPRDPGSYGLGLSNVGEAAGLANIQIEVIGNDSSKQGGATFFVVFRPFPPESQ